MDHYNQLTPAEAERLALLAEECGEAIQAAMKILRHGYNGQYDNGIGNREKLVEELGHVCWAMQLMCEAGDVEWVLIVRAGASRESRPTNYLHHQQRRTGEL